MQGHPRRAREAQGSEGGGEGGSTYRRLQITRRPLQRAALIIAVLARSSSRTVTLLVVIVLAVLMLVIVIIYGMLQGCEHRLTSRC